MEQLSGVPALDLTVRSTLVLTLAWLTTLALRRSSVSAATRHLVWASSMVAVLLLPALSALLPELPIPIRLPEGHGSLPPGLPSDFGTAAADPTPSWASLAALLYALGVAVLLARLAHARWVLSRLWTSATHAGSSWRELLEADRAALGLRRPVNLRLSGSSFVPMTWGTFAPKVLLPSDAQRWSSERRHLVLMHELAHVSRADTLSQAAAALVCVFYWFNPIAWLAARQMRAEQEYAADEIVLAAGAHSLTYARCLVDLAEKLGRRSPTLHAAATHGASQLESRVVAIVSPARRRGSRSHAAAVGACLLISTVFVSTAVPLRAVESVPSSVPGGVADSESLKGESREISNTAAGSAPPEAAAPRVKPAHMPVETSTRPPSGRSAQGKATPGQGTPQGTTNRAEGVGARADHAPPVAEAGRLIPPSRARGLSGVPASHPLSPEGIPAPVRSGEGPLPPQADFSP
jgi:beta-lactamase regulating signal transducer with metallopeptidase domain